MESLSDPTHCIPAAESPLVPPLVQQYLKQASQVAPLVAGFNTTQNFEKHLNERRFSPEQRKVLAQHFHAQYARIGVSGQPLQQRIDTLLDPNTFTVTTGHQLVLFGGPLFTVYKILTTIKLADELNRLHPDKKVIPVFWMASEDHDFEEISEVFINHQTFKWERANDEQPVGRIPLTGLEGLMNSVLQQISENQRGQYWRQLITSAYKEGRSLSDATIHFFHLLFEGTDLLILDPDAVGLKETFKPVMLADIFEKRTHDAQAQSDRLLAQQYDLQIHARDINFFYLDPTNGRRLIQPHGKGFELKGVGTRFSKAELEKLIESHPERFSPNVSLRPVYQEMILPNLAYIGGPAELAYWMQLKSVLDEHHVQMPILVLRHMQINMPPGITNRLRELNLEPYALLQKEAVLRTMYDEGQGEFVLDPQIEVMMEQWQQIIEQLGKWDELLASSAIKEKLAHKETLKTLKNEHRRAIDKRQAERFQKILGYKALIYPTGVLQERIEQLVDYEVLLQKSLLSEWKDRIKPFEAQVVFWEY